MKKSAWTHLAVFLSLALVPRVAGAVPAGPVAGFTEEEAVRLRKGRAVRRPLEDHDRLVGGNSWLVISAPPSEVWRALNDLQTYKRMFGFVDRIDVLRSEGNRRTVQIEETDPLFTLSYILQMRFDAENHDVEFRLDPSTREHLRDGWGFVHLDSLPNGKTLLTYGAAVNPGNDMVRALFEDGLQDHLLGAPERLKRFIEREERRRMRARNLARRAARRGFPTIERNRMAERAAEMRARAEVATAVVAPQATQEVADVTPWEMARDSDCNR